MILNSWSPCSEWWSQRAYYSFSPYCFFSIANSLLTPDGNLAAVYLGSNCSTSSQLPVIYLKFKVLWSSFDLCANHSWFCILVCKDCNHGAPWNFHMFMLKGDFDLCESLSQQMIRSFSYV